MRGLLLPRLRRLGSTILLAVFLLNGGLEAAAMAGMILRAGLPAPAVEMDCTCTCCGDVCPMGDACCCDAAKVPRPQPAGLFFKPLGCTPSAEPDSAALPDSLTFRFLLAQPIAPSCCTALRLPLALEPNRLISRIPSPPAPPPRIAA